MFQEDLQAINRSELRFVGVPINSNNHWKLLIAFYPLNVIHYLDPFGESIQTCNTVKELWT